MYNCAKTSRCRAPTGERTAIWRNLTAAGSAKEKAAFCFPAERGLLVKGKMIMMSGGVRGSSALRPGNTGENYCIRLQTASA